MNKRSWLLVSAAATLLALVGLRFDADAQSPSPTQLARTPQLSTLSKLINDAGLADTLRGPGPLTLFAPTDEAFKQVPAKTLAELAANKQMQAAVLTYHVVQGKVMSADVKNGKVKTVNGAERDAGPGRHVRHRGGRGGGARPTSWPPTAWCTWSTRVMIPPKR